MPYENMMDQSPNPRDQAIEKGPNLQLYGLTRIRTGNKVTPTKYLKTYYPTWD